MVVDLTAQNLCWRFPEREEDDVPDGTRETFLLKVSGPARKGKMACRAFVIGRARVHTPSLLQRALFSDGKDGMCCDLPRSETNETGVTGLARVRLGVRGP
ncbi:hypothetical protein SKAU_G00147860 [Synaphobranchus kaupii]|uniref:Uncharacterized protein n=1 Tax=Synaphobranchus kaupii TaxID=118154 RepID=A0A9Q1FUH4_SYNKA|nr:hypothetical protein SKAU_G00147860 [Synaphobranchus kaupii]